FHTVDVGLAVHPVVRFHTHTNTPPGIDDLSGSKGIPRLVFADVHPYRVAAAVDHTFARCRIKSDSPQFRFLCVCHPRKVFQGIQLVLRMGVMYLEMEMRSARTAAVAAQRNLFTPLYR